MTSPAGPPEAPLRVLNPHQSALLIAEREALSDLREALATLDADQTDLSALKQASLDLDDLFLLVVVGEFNAGKSVLLNALLGGPYLEEGVTPTTAEVTVIRFGDSPSSRSLPNGVLERALPAPLLKDLSIVDTPGTNAIIRQHEQLTREFVPRSDLVLFVTSVDRPFSESERAFMEHIRAWGKKVVIVLNKSDLLRDTAELDQIKRFVTENVSALLGFTPQLFAVSGRLAFDARAGAGDPAAKAGAWQRSGFEPLERYLLETLDQTERIRLKLLNPLGIAERVAARQSERTAARLDVLRADLKGANEIDGQLELYRSDLRRDFERRLYEVENVVHELNDRAGTFFDETLRLARIFDLFNSDRVRGDFERKVISDSAQRIDTAVQSLVDWMLDQEQRLWRSVAEYVNERPLDGQTRATQLIDSDWSFAKERQRMLDAVERAASQALTQYDAESEARRFSLSMREAVTQTALTQVGALSLGTAVVALIGTTAADVTGILAASVMAGLGLYIIPLRRRQAREQFRKKADSLRDRLKEGMTRQFETELERSVQRIREVIAPYSRRVRSEHDRLSTGLDRLTNLSTRLTTLRTTFESPVAR